MPTKETLNSRVTRLEEGQIRLDNALAYLAESHAKTEEQFRRTDARLAELREESDRREARMDERIGHLVSAIGELITRMPPAMTT
jgi:predicted  nucleic acid-binding Zn-ribbon protein